MIKLIYIYFSTLVILLNVSIRSDQKDRMYFNDNFRLNLVRDIQKVTFQFTDTIPDDTLHFCYSGKEFPMAVFRNIRTGVCLDGECRIVSLRIYWTITGRYLGYSLAAGQELTKKEHVIFLEKEYALLHQLLSDSVSLLSHYTLEELQPVKKQDIHTDGISGATSPDLSGYIVPEAAFTSYTLWHIVYGDTRDSLRKWSYQHLKAPLLDSLLRSPQAYDRLWAVNALSISPDPCKYFAPQLIAMLQDNNYRQVKQALSYLQACSVPDSAIQQKLLLLFQNKNQELKYLAIDYYKNHRLHLDVIHQMIQLLKANDPDLVSNILSQLESYSLSQVELTSISELLDNKNKEIEWRAYTFLIVLQDQNVWLKRKLKGFIREYGKEQ